jgi:hypothetical protein
MRDELTSFPECFPHAFYHDLSLQQHCHFLGNYAGIFTTNSQKMQRRNYY